MIIPKIDQIIGINTYSTSSIGCGGSIRNNINDFIVTEILSNTLFQNITNNGKYTIYTLKKMNIDTNHVLNHIKKKHKIKMKAFGLKDSRAITKQYVYTETRNTPKIIIDKKYILNKIGHTNKISKQDMIGNIFNITIKKINNIIKFNKNEKILNFFGYQRFGADRPVTHLVGKYILQKKFTDAINIFLTLKSTKYLKNNKIREELADSSKYTDIIKKIPIEMDLEKILIYELIKSNNPIKAIRALPISIRRFFIQAYQSYIFNKTLSMAFNNDEKLFVPCDNDICFDHMNLLTKFSHITQKLAIPLIGYGYYKKTRFDTYIKQILKEEDIRTKDFFIKELQEISNDGGFRETAITYTNFFIFNDTVKFMLQRGGFATIILREIMKPKDPINVGF